MGVRGLTSFIARHAEYYLKPYELHDCNLVIDGDNLACNLFKDVAGKNSAFGGDYDSFYRSVVEFFHVLSECNIRAYVLLDGGYEKKKLRTVWQRMRGKIAGIKKIDPINSHHIFPLMLREVFVDALNDCNVPVMRCVFEADEELAALSRKLNCPVLSYDSDFYIYNCKYIPLVTLTVRAHTKKVSQNTTKDKLTKSNAKHLEKRSKAHKIIGNIEVDAVDRKAPKTGKTYKYLDCCLYKIEYLVEGGRLSRDKLPLFAALLGNDYIAGGAFSAFFAQMKQKGMSKRTTRIQKRIQKIIQWLRHETVESALEKILCSLKKWERRGLLQQVKGVVEGYSAESCASYQFFKTHYKDGLEEDEDSDEDVEEEESIDDDPEDEEELEDDEETEEADENPSAEDEPKNQDPCHDDSPFPNENDGKDHEDDDDEVTDPNAFLPQWFKDRLYPAKLPRFLVDLAHLRIYINNPQIEHFLFNDCNEIGLPILKHIFCLLYNVRGFEEDKIFSGDPYAGEEVPYFRYLTRLTRVTNIHTVRCPLEPQPSIPFYPDEPHQQLFRIVFNKLQVDNDKLFREIEKIPSDLQLYFLALVYWIQNTPHADLLHLHALIICLVVLRTVDSKVEPIRDPKAFQKRFGKTVKKELNTRIKEQLAGVVKELKPEIQNLPPLERIKFISKTDCLLVQENLLKHFHMQELFKKKYDAFSSQVLHGFAEFQSVVFNLHALNGLLGNIYESPRMAQAYCGVFIYNIYELLRSRINLSYYIRMYIFPYSTMMFDLYEFFWNWCDQFVPEWQRNKTTPMAVSKNVLKKRKAAAKRKSRETAAPVDPNADMLESESTETAEEDDFCDLNNKFCTLLEIK